MKFRPEHFCITLIVFIIIGIFSFSPFNWGFLDPVGKALSDFDIYDIVFSRLRTEQQADTNIVIVNIGYNTRRQIAHQLELLNALKPKVIAVDAFFPAPKEAEEDSLLARAMAHCRNLILVSGLSGYSQSADTYNSNGTSLPCFSRYAKTGFANLPEDEKGSFRTIRTFRPFASVKNSGTCPSFAIKIASVYDSASAAVCLERNNETEIINFRGNKEKFYFLDTEDFTGDSLNAPFIKNKIVMLGFTGSASCGMSLEDIFFTPLNEKYAGRTFPDMYGIFIHANIVSMLLQKTYIDRMPFLLSLFVAVIFCWICTVILIYIKERLHDLFGGITKAAFFLLTILNLLLGVYIFSYFSYKINLTLTIASVFLIPTAIDIYRNYVEKILKKFTVIYASRLSHRN